LHHSKTATWLRLFGENESMAQLKDSTETELGEIQRQMAQIRHDLHEDVVSAVQGAQSFTDWRSLVRAWPWLALPAAALAGYMAVPARRRPAPPLPVYMNAPPIAVGQQTLAREATRPVSVGGVFGAGLGLLAPVLVRAAQSFAAARLESWLTENYLGPGVPQDAAPTTATTRPAPTFPRVVEQ
jgi:hypothetical protein